VEFKTLTAENVQPETTQVLDWLKEEHPDLLEDLLRNPPKLEKRLLSKTQSVLQALVGSDDPCEILSMMLPDREWENEEDLPPPLSPWAEQKYKEWRQALIDLNTST
jgi:hypothetical protein